MPYIGNKTSKFKTADELTVTGDATVTGSVDATSYTGDGSALTGISSDLVDDTTPQLGGNLDAQTNDITNVGDLGVGVTSPSYPLDVKTTGTGTTAGSNTAIALNSGASGRDANIRFGDSVNSTARIGYLNPDLYFYVNGAERMRVDSSGKVGVGTSSTVARLTVRGDDTAAHFRGSDTESLDITCTDGGTVELNSNNATLALSVNTVERMTINSSGEAEFKGRVSIPSTSYFVGNTAQGFRFNNQADTYNIMQMFDNGRIGYKSEGSNNIRATTDMRQGASKMWSAIDGKGTIATKDSYNLSSIADLGTGRYRSVINNDMNNANYAVTMGVARDNNYNEAHFNFRDDLSGTGDVEYFMVNRSASAVDGENIGCNVHGDLA